MLIDRRLIGCNLQYTDCMQDIHLFSNLMSWIFLRNQIKFLISKQMAVMRYLFDKNKNVYCYQYVWQMRFHSQI